MVEGDGLSQLASERPERRRRGARTESGPFAQYGRSVTPFVSDCWETPSDSLMNVIQISHLYRPSIGGIENYCYRLSNSLRDSGNDVSIITTDSSLANDDSPLDRESNATYCSTTTTVFRNPLSIQLYRRVRESDASLYHLHSPWYLSSLTAALALSSDTPLVMTIHGFQPLQSATAQLLNTAYRPFAQYVFDRVDRTIVLGLSEKRRLVRNYDVPPDDVAVIPNGIHPDSYDVPPAAVRRVRTKYEIDPATPTVLFCSRLVPLKNPDAVVGAISEYLPGREMDVLMVGNGEESYIDELEDRGDERFTFLSNLPFDDLKALYHASSLFVLPSHMEGLPTVVLEAMNARLPVITTPVGALGDVVTHGEHGWLLDTPPDERSVATAIRHYLDQPSERQEVGQRNRDYVRREFDWADIATEIEAVYRGVLDRSTELRVAKGDL